MKNCSNNDILHILIFAHDSLNIYPTTFQYFMDTSNMLDNMVKFVFKTDVQVKVEVNLKDNIWL